MQEGEEVLDYFRAALKQYHRLPTYQWLEQSGIVPSSTTMYTYAQIQAAIKVRLLAAPTLSRSPFPTQLGLPAY